MRQIAMPVAICRTASAPFLAALFPALPGTKTTSSGCSWGSGAFAAIIFLSESGTSCGPSGVLRMTLAESSAALGLVPSEGDGLQHSNIIAVFHDKTAGLVDITDDVNDTRFAHQNCVTGLNSDVILHRLRCTGQKRYPNRMLRIIAACDQHLPARFARTATASGYGVVQLPRAQQWINAGPLHLAQ